MTKRIKVMHIINNLEIGGAETLLVDLARELRGFDDIEMTVVSLEGKGALRDELRGNGVAVKEFGFRLFLKGWNRFDPSFRWRLLSHVLRERPDIIHGHLVKGEDFAKVLGWLLGKPVIITFHDTIAAPGIKQRLLNRFISCAVAVSSPVTEYLKHTYGIPQRRIALIPNGIRMERFAGKARPLDRERPVFTYVGRIVHGKGIEHAMEALAMLQVDYPGLIFRLWGPSADSDDWTMLTGLAVERGWDFVEFMGPTDDVPAALGAADFFIMLSATEGFSMAVLEAAAAGKPIIATRVGSIPQMVEDGKSGYLVDYGDVSGAYQAACRLIQEGVGEAFGRRSRSLVVDRFDIREVARRYVGLYRSLGE